MHIWSWEIESLISYFAFVSLPRDTQSPQPISSILQECLEVLYVQSLSLLPLTTGKSGLWNLFVLFNSSNIYWVKNIMYFILKVLWTRVWAQWVMHWLCKMRTWLQSPTLTLKKIRRYIPRCNLNAGDMYRGGPLGLANQSI